MRTIWITYCSSALAALLLCAPVQAALRVLACEPEWAALVKEIGDDQVRVSSATSPFQDPHRIEARPSLIARVRNADLLVCTGLDLEVGWLPILLRQSNNPAIQPGQPGYLQAGRVVPVLDLPNQLDRSQGDVHAYGNPHIQLDPHNIVRVADALSERLAVLDPKHASEYAARLDDFRLRWDTAMTRWQQCAAPLQGIKAISHHKDMVYLFHWLNITEVGNLEPKPGLDPSSAHLAALLQRQRHNPAELIIRTPYQNERASQWFSSHASIPAIEIPSTVGSTGGATDLFSWFDEIVNRLLEATR